MTHSLSPTSVLPALAVLRACSAARVEEALQTLRDVYFAHTSTLALMGVVPVLKQTLSEAVPVFRTKKTVRLVHHDGVPDSGYASAEEDEEEGDEKETECIDEAAEEVIEEEDETLDVLRSDEFERSYAIKWLTGLVKRGDVWMCGTPSEEEQAARTTCLEDASRLLARFAGDDAPEEALMRTFCFPLRVAPCRRCGLHSRDASSPSPPITIELNDAPVDGTDHTAVGLQSWGSAIVFAERVCLDPERYLGALCLCSCVSIRPRRVLELGAGTGLLSITAAQIFSRASIQAEIVATDYHPSVLDNLARNIGHNPSVVDVSADKLNWRAEDDDGVAVYDIVLAADVVYHPEHARWIRGCVERKMDEDGVFWMIIPERTTGRHAGLGETVEEAFPVVGDVKEEDRSGKRLAVVGREEVARVDGVGRADEGGYTLFEIRWI